MQEHAGVISFHHMSSENKTLVLRPKAPLPVSVSGSELMKMFEAGGKFSDLNEEKNTVLLYVIYEPILYRSARFLHVIRNESIHLVLFSYEI